ncbi:hypothetical protein DMUE_4012 [Dictyocoela muelleri]|nr:hypothetical protein DMUE_4012 [Dictyocoela muelleri]
MEPLKIVMSQKGKKKIIYKRFIYNLDRKCINYIAWRCHRRGCTGRIHTDFEKKNILHETTHWHEMEDAKITRLEINAKLNELANTSDTPFEKAIMNSTLNISPNDLNRLGKYDSLRDYYVRRQNLKNEFNKKRGEGILDIFRYTFDNEQFLQFDGSNSEKNDFLIFYTAQNLEVLQDTNL